MRHDNSMGIVLLLLACPPRPPGGSIIHKDIFRVDLMIKHRAKRAQRGSNNIGHSSPRINNMYLWVCSMCMCCEWLMFKYIFIKTATSMLLLVAWQWYFALRIRTSENSHRHQKKKGLCLVHFFREQHYQTGIVKGKKYDEWLICNRENN